MTDSRILVALLFLIGALVSDPRAAAAQNRDHLECFKIRDSLRFAAGSLIDLETQQLGLQPNCRLKRAKYYCVPAEKQNPRVLAFTASGPIPTLEDFTGTASSEDRICYTVKCDSLEIPDQEVSDQFGTRPVSLKKSELVCTPAIQGAEYCGDGVINGVEQCEPGDTGGTSCQDLGFGGGTLACVPGCASFDTSGCTSMGSASGLPATGQKTSYAAGDDGALEFGHPLAYSDNGDGTITAPGTGLLWEKKSDDGSIHDVDRTFTWAAAVNPSGSFLGVLNATCNGNGGVACDDDPDCVGVGAGRCGLGGRRDWRLPNRRELDSIVNLSISTPGPTTSAAFHSACSGGCSAVSCSCTANQAHWTSTTDASNTATAWYFNFLNSEVGRQAKGTAYSARAVAGGTP